MALAAQFGMLPKLLRRQLPTLLKASYQPHWQARKTLTSLGYAFDRELSIDGAIVINNDVTGPVVLFRGTQNKSDWLNENLPLIVGQDGPRHEAARVLVTRVEAKYKRPAHVIGHSLGGRLAERSGASGLVLTANKGACLDSLARPQTNQRQLDVRVVGDPVSALSRGGLRERVVPTYTGADLLSNAGVSARVLRHVPAPVRLPIRFIANGLAAHARRNIG